MGGETASHSGVSASGTRSASATGDAVGDRDLRVSDAEREHVGQLLQRAVGLGMLSLGEYTERMDTALVAKTRGELNSVLIDLPGIRLDGRPGPGQPGPTPPGPGRPGPTPAPPSFGRDRTAPSSSDDVIRARLSGVTRKGRWQVAPVLQLQNMMSGVTLDFTQAVMSTQVVEVQVDDFCSSLTLIVPSAATVDLNGLDLIGSSANSKVRTGPPYGALHLVVYGRLRFGSVTAKQPFAAQWRRLMAGF